MMMKYQQTDSLFDDLKNLVQQYEHIDMMCMYSSKMIDAGSNLMDRMMYSWLWSE